MAENMVSCGICGGVMRNQGFLGEGKQQKARSQKIRQKIRQNGEFSLAMLVLALAAALAACLVWCMAQHEVHPQTLI